MVDANERGKSIDSWQWGPPSVTMSADVDRQPTISCAATGAPRLRPAHRSTALTAAACVHAGARRGPPDHRPTDRRSRMALSTPPPPRCQPTIARTQVADDRHDTWKPRLRRRHACLLCSRLSLVSAITTTTGSSC